MPPQRPRPAQAKAPVREGAGQADRMPTNEELLYELRKHGAPPPPPREIPAVSRRTRDYLLLAGVGSAVILFVAFRLVGGGNPAVVLRLGLTGVGLYCGLLWFILFGVISRY